MELWCARITVQSPDSPTLRRTIIATDNGMILSHVVQQKLDEPRMIDGQPTDWSEIKEIAGKFFMMTGGFSSTNVESPPEPFLAAISKFQGLDTTTKIMRSECGHLAQIVMSPLITFVNIKWVDTQLEEALAQEFVARALNNFPAHFMVQPVTSLKLDDVEPILTPKLGLDGTDEQ